MRIGPVLICYDGSEAAKLAIVEAGALLPGRQALVIVVYKQGLGLELVQLPAVAAVGQPPATLDVRTAMEVDREMAEHARRLSQEGAQVAAEAGFADPEGVAIADDVDTPVAETIATVARERHAQVVVVGGQGQSRVREALLGNTTRDVIRHAPCPVLVVREGRTGRRLTAPEGVAQP